MPEIKTGNAGNQAQGGRALSSQPVFHAQFPVGKQEYAEFGQAPYVWLIKFHLICLAVILLSFLMQAITEQNYLCCACVSGVSALLCGSYDIQAERGSRLAYRRHMISEGKPGTIYFLNFCGYLVSATDTHTPMIINPSFPLPRASAFFSYFFLTGSISLWKRRRYAAEAERNF